jgi:hypothetical protein
MNEIKFWFKKVVLLLALFAGAGVANAQFTYADGAYGAPGDLLVCFRPASGSYDLVVDCGSVTAFTNLTVGQKIAITNYYSPSKLSYTGTNNMYWSALARQANGPIGNIWVTRPRSSLNTQSTPWPCKSYSTQNGAGSQIDSIGDDAANIAAGGDPFGTSPANGNTYVVEPEGGSSSGNFYNSYSYQMVNKDGYGDLDGNFWGDSGGVSLEQSTPANFTTAGQPVRADFYQMLSVSNGLPAKYLGYFELSTNGVLTYTAGPSPTVLTAPRIVSFTHTGNTSTIYFTTVSGAYNYTLRGTNSMGLTAAKTNWPAIGSSVAGNGLTNSIVEITTSNPRFYIITAQ